MENYNVYEDIASRTGGDIYVGVVGPVRTGKSTFIRKFMQTLVIPMAQDVDVGVMTDELPQAAAGKTVMTTEPKFVPAKAAKISVSKGASASVRLVDCVGFAVDGASGFEEDGKARLVKTPWQEEPMPFEQAARLGTEKVIREHSTIGVLVTTDGSVTEIARENYVPAEERTVEELKTINKPFVIVLNCKKPEKAETLRKKLEEKYGVAVVAVNVETMGEDEMTQILQKALFEFPVTRIDVCIPRWLQSFSQENFAVAAIMQGLKKLVPHISRMRDLFVLESLFDGDSDFTNPTEIKMELGKGCAEITLAAVPDLFYRVISEESGETIADELQLMQYVKELSAVKKGYAKVKDAMAEAEANGYGIVYPTESDYVLNKPELVKKSAGYAAQFKANATSYHIVKVDIMGAVSPIIGTKEQGEDFIGTTLSAYEKDDGQVWETNIFGKSLRDLVGDALSGKSNAMPVELRRKLRRIVTKIVNDGKNNIFCLLF